MTGARRSYVVSHQELYAIALEHHKELEPCFNHLKAKHPDWPQEPLDELREYLSKTFLPRLRDFRKKSHRNQSSFDNRFDAWLEKEFCSPLLEANTPTVAAATAGPSRTPPTRRGRLVKSFNECGERSQRMKIRQLQQSTEPELLRKAAPSMQITPERACGMLIGAGLTKFQYEYMRMEFKNLGLDILPTYRRVVTVKKTCYPENVDYRESGVLVGLQELLNHTSERLLTSKTVPDLGTVSSELRLLSKWGCDGSSGHSEYKQRFEDPTLSDTSIFLTSVVPLKLMSAMAPHTIYWENPAPSSTRYTRLLGYQFVKESIEVIKNEVGRVEDQIRNLNACILEIDGYRFSIAYDMILSMIDGKVVQVVNDSPSTQRCPHCKCPPSDMNNLPAVYSKAESLPALSAPLPTLHARIKFMECVLHIAYRLDFKKWRVTKDHTAARDLKKKAIQNRFLSERGLSVDFVRNQVGTSNDGNTSRRFFADPSLASEITGVDETLIDRFATILDTINCFGNIHAREFDLFCRQTAKLYVELYPWYPMPASVHVVLIHGAQIIANSPYPVGRLSEEAQEAMNKVYRYRRNHNSRKIGRLATNQDVAHWIFAYSDPWLHDYMRPPARNCSPKTNPKVNALLEDLDDKSGSDSDGSD